MQHTHHGVILDQLQFMIMNPWRNNTMLISLPIACNDSGTRGHWTALLSAEVDVSVMCGWEQCSLGSIVEPQSARAASLWAGDATHQQLLPGSVHPAQPAFLRLVCQLLQRAAEERACCPACAIHVRQCFLSSAVSLLFVSLISQHMKGLGTSWLLWCCLFPLIFPSLLSSLLSSPLFSFILSSHLLCSPPLVTLCFPILSSSHLITSSCPDLLLSSPPPFLYPTVYRTSPSCSTWSSYSWCCSTPTCSRWAW